MSEIDRVPFPTDNFKQFLQLFLLLSEKYEITKDTKVANACQMFVEALVKKTLNDDSNENGQGREIRKFFAVYNDKYKTIVGQANEQKSGPREINLIMDLIVNLNSKSFVVDEYLNWFFDEFLKNNPKMIPPTFNLCASTNILSKFMYEKAELMKSRQDQDYNKKQLKDLIGRTRVLLRIFKEKNLDTSDIAERLTKLREGKIDVDELKGFVERVERSITMEN